MAKANERAVRNWFQARNGPSGEHLVVLMHHSPAVVETVLVMAGRQALVQAKLAADARDHVRRILTMLDSLTEA